MNWLLHILDDAPFPAPDPRDRNWVRLIFSILGGLVATVLTVLLCVAAAAFVVAMVMATGGYVQGGAQQVQEVLTAAASPDAPMTFTRTLMILLLVTILNCAAFFTFVGIAALVMRQRFKAYVTSAPRFRWRLLFAGMGLFTLILSPLFAVGFYMDPEVHASPILTMAHDWDGRALYAAAALVLLTPAAAAEEVLFRGWLLRQTGAFLRHPWILVAVNGALFSAIHMDPNLDAFIARWVMGAAFTYMAMRLGGIEFAIGAHAANNTIIVIFLQPLSLSNPVHEFSPWVLIGDTVLALGLVGITEIAARWGPLRRWAEVDIAPPPPESEAVFA